MSLCYWKQLNAVGTTDCSLVILDQQQISFDFILTQHVCLGTKLVKELIR